MSIAPVTVVFLVSTLRQTGPTSQLLNLVSHLDRSVFEPVVITLSGETARSMLSAFERAGAIVRSISLSRVSGAFHRAWRKDIERLAGRPLDAGVVHSQGIRADVISSSALGGVPRIATARNYPFDDYVMKFGRLAGTWMARRHLQAFRALPRVVACSTTLAGRLGRHGVEATVIRNGVDTKRFEAPSTVRRNDIRAGLDLAPSHRVALCVGSLVERKDPLTIVRALRSVDDERLEMIFVGGGALERRCRREAEGDRRIRFVGHVSDVRAYLQAADFLVSASRSEGMPNAVLEALACGLPLVLSDIEPHRELLQFVPTAGVIFSAGDPSALADAIRGAVRPGWMAEGLRPGQAEELVGARRMSLNYQRLYLDLVQSGHRR